MTVNWTLKEADAADYYTLSVIHGACFARRWSAGELRALTLDASASALVAMMGEEIAGFVLPRVAANEAEILTIAVAPPHQRKGAGAFLLNEAITWAARKGAEEVFLEVAEDNVSAKALYVRSGFRPAGRRPGYFEGVEGGHGSAKTALVMRLEMGK